MSLLDVFATAILPIITIAGVGVLLGRRTALDTDPLTTVTVYVLAPALVFHSLATTTLSGGTILRIVVGNVVFIVAMLAVAEATGRTVGEREPLLGTFVLVSVFGNTGNYGIPLAEFTFGQEGRAVAVLVFVMQAALTYVLGTYVAARSAGDGWRHGVRTVVSLPLAWAVVAAGLARVAGVVPPADGTAMTTVELVGESAIPLMLLILGVELVGSDHAAAVSRVTRVGVLRFAVAPLLAVGVALALGFGDGTVARVFVLQCSMPAAVTPMILVAEFASDERIDGLSASQFASTTILVTTLVSVPYLTALVTLLQSGVLV